MKFRYFLFDCKYTEISWIVRNNFDYNKCKSLEGGRKIMRETGTSCPHFAK